MNIDTFAKIILFNENLEDKLLVDSNVTFNEFELYSIPQTPSRSSKIKFSDTQMKFPKRPTLHLDEKKAMALNSFANHELLAIEMMACALLIFPNATDEQIRMKKGILSALRDEQLHFKMYRNRMNELGYEFGDFPINDFFWKQMHKMDTPERFFAVMSLTFEAANLDFAIHYESIFKEIDDFKTAAILRKVYEDEISHVGLGVNYLNRWRGDKSLWEYYLTCLPFPLTPDRSKGALFHRESRVSSGMDESFISSLVNYKDDFKVTKRKGWEK